MSKKDPLRFTIRFNPMTENDMSAIAVKYLNRIPDKSGYIARLIYQDLLKGGMIQEVSAWNMDMPIAKDKGIVPAWKTIELKKNETAQSVEVFDVAKDDDENFDNELLAESADFLGEI